MIRHVTVAVLVFASSASGSGEPRLDLAPFGTRFADPESAGVKWSEERDVSEIRVRWAGVPPDARAEYWYRKSPLSDQGEWLAAAVSRKCDESGCMYTFAPPRRTLKVRLAGGGVPDSFQVFSGTRETPLRVRVAFEQPARVAAVEVFNGSERARSWEGATLLLDLTAADAAPSGSPDRTVVTVRAEPRAFSFCTADLEGGPIRIPGFGATVTADGRGTPPVAGDLAAPPVPPPLAVDSSWQKFRVESGGRVFAGDGVRWKVGDDDTGPAATPLEGWLPVIERRWENQGLRWSQEAFATLLRGPLPPVDAARSERTSAVLLVRLEVENPGPEARTADVWLAADPAQPLDLSGRRLLAPGGVRAAFDREDGEISGGRYHLALPVAPGGTRSVVLKFPYVAALDAEDLEYLDALDYVRERYRVITYWRRIVTAGARFEVPDARLSNLLKAAAVHLRLAAVRDPERPVAGYPVLLLDELGDRAAARQAADALLRQPLDGAALWTLVEYFLYTRERAWFDRAWPKLEEALASGPPAAQSFSDGAFEWAGLEEMALVSEAAGKPEAAAWRRAADRYRSDLRAAAERAASMAPVVRLSDGTYAPQVPASPERRFGGASPMALASLGVFAPEEPAAGWVLNGREDTPEAIPAYLRRGDAAAALRAVERAIETGVVPEAEAGFLCGVRDLLVREDGEVLWLADGVPRKWLEAGEGVRVEDAASRFGPLGYTLHAGAEPGTVEATVRPPVRNPARAAYLVVRAAGRLTGATVNGQTARIDAAREAVELPPGPGPLQVVVRFAP